MQEQGHARPNTLEDVEDPICELTLALGDYSSSSSDSCPKLIPPYSSLAPAPLPPPPSSQASQQLVPAQSPLLPPQLPPSHPNSPPPPPPARTGRRARRNPTPAPKGRHKDAVIPPPFAWATDRRARVHTLGYLLSNGITEIQGEAQCKRCEAKRVIRYDLVGKFREVAGFVGLTKHLMHDRAPAEWMTPAFPECETCGQPNCMRPVVAAKKRDVNWLFMLLGQTLGCCTLRQLKYFCKHTVNHRTGAKDRVLYLTYLTLCKQLDPSGPC